MTLTAGYGTYADYFRFHDGMLENVFDPGAAQRFGSMPTTMSPRSTNRKGDGPSISSGHGRTQGPDVDLYDARDAVRIPVGLHCREDGEALGACVPPTTRATALGPVVGAIPISLRLGISSDAGRTFNIAVEANLSEWLGRRIQCAGPTSRRSFMLDPITTSTSR
jgi:hypothetical protein